MSVAKKVEHAAEDVKGKAKETVGRVTGQEDMEAEGRGEQAVASVKHKGDQVADGAKNAAQDVKGKAEELAGRVAGDRDQQAEGQGDQAAAAVKQDLNK